MQQHEHQRFDGPALAQRVLDALHRALAPLGARLLKQEQRIESSDSILDDHERRLATLEERHHGSV